MSKTPWRVDKKVAEAIAEAVAEKLQRADEAIKLSQVMGQCCNDKKVIVVEMALATMLAHIIDDYPSPEKKQEVLDRFIKFVIGMVDE